MTILGNEPLAKKATFDSTNMWVELTDGRKLGIPLAYFPRLLHAAPKQLENYEISGGGTGLHWEELDEDILVKGLMMGLGDRNRPSSSTHKEISPTE
ncbi:MAG: DUF2442 domain-containing protein [Nitrospinae bacterium]|nr:DUF2442 domain-containing protein [Nitrospinota bacterium]